MSHSSPTILITGGAGFIGSHLVEHYQGRAKEIRVLDDLRSGHRENLSALKHTYISGSITDRETVMAATQGVDYIFHLAALVSVPESMQQPLLCQELNVIGFLNILDAAHAAGVKHVVLSSSAAIYGDNPTVPKCESMTPEPKSPYAITKLDGEYYGQLYQREKGLGFTALRYFNVFGPRQDPNSAYAAAVPIFIKQALAHKPITIFGDGGQTRDFVYVKDVAAANAFAAESNGKLTGVYNVGYAQPLSILELAQRIIAETNSRSEIRHEAERAGDVRHSLAAVERLRKCGFQPQGTLDTGLQATLHWYRTQNAQTHT